MKSLVYQSPIYDRLNEETNKVLLLGAVRRLT
jgi:hypothetical protein